MSDRHPSADLGRATEGNGGRAIDARAFAVLARPGEGLGLRLAGAAVHEVPPGEEALRLRALLADPAIALVAVEGEVYRALPEAILRAARARGAVLVPFDLARRWGARGAGRDWVAALIRRAIGYQIQVEPAR